MSNSNALLFAAGAAALFLGVTSPVEAVGIPGQGTWETTLQPRDVNLDGVVDAYFDSDLNVTWLADAWPLGGDTVSWNSAVAYATHLNIYGVTGWRLPHTIDAASSMGFPPFAGSSELAHMYLSTLGDGAQFGLQNTGPFANLQAYIYWSGTEHAPANDLVWTFGTALPIQSLYPKDVGLYAWAVHDGDIAAIPEPAVSGLLVAGFVGLLARRRRLAAPA